MERSWKRFGHCCTLGAKFSENSEECFEKSKQACDGTIRHTKHNLKLERYKVNHRANANNGSEALLDEDKSLSGSLSH